MPPRLHEIAPGLWMGGASAQLAPGTFDRVVTLCWADEERVPVPPGTAAVAWRFADAAMPDAGAVRAWAARISGWLDSGETVLVRCAAGRNRSGLIVARVLIEQGMTPSEAIATVRRRRSLDALNNVRFTDWLLAEGAERPGPLPLLPASLRIRSRRWAVPWTSDMSSLEPLERAGVCVAAGVLARLGSRDGGAAAAGSCAGLLVLVVPLALWRRRMRHEAAVAALVAALVARSTPPPRLRDPGTWWPALAGAAVAYQGLRERLL